MEVRIAPFLEKVKDRASAERILKGYMDGPRMEGCFFRNARALSASEGHEMSSRLDRIMDWEARAVKSD